jgi:hypothetical protein
MQQGQQQRTKNVDKCGMFVFLRVSGAAVSADDLIDTRAAQT